MTITWWVLIVSTGFPAAIVLARAGVQRLRKRGHKPGVCPVCGYDLLATPERCPECGTVPPDAPAKPD